VPGRTSNWLLFSIHDQIRESILPDLIDARYGTANIYKDREEARKDISHYSELLYNPVRRHGHLANLTQIWGKESE